MENPIRKYTESEEMRRRRLRKAWAQLYERHGAKRVKSLPNTYIIKRRPYNYVVRLNGVKTIPDICNRSLRPKPNENYSIVKFKRSLSADGWDEPSKLFLQKKFHEYKMPAKEKAKPPADEKDHLCPKCKLQKLKINNVKPNTKTYISEIFKSSLLWIKSKINIRDIIFMIIYIIVWLLLLWIILEVDFEDCIIYEILNVYKYLRHSMVQKYQSIFYPKTKTRTEKAIDAVTGFFNYIQSHFENI